MRKSNELQIGKAGQYLVCADIAIMGLIAYPAEELLPYDIVIDNGTRLLRAQVKTTLGPRVIPQRNKETLAYIFNVKTCGSKRSKRYSPNEIDIYALVELGGRSVVYLKNEDMPTTINIRVDELRGTYYDEKGMSDHEKVKKLLGDGLNRHKIAKLLGLHSSAVYRMSSDGYIPHKTNARYWSDLKKDKNWFLSI